MNNNSNNNNNHRHNHNQLVFSDGPRPSQNDIVDLRFLMLEYVRQLVLRGSGVQDDELQSIMNFLTTVHEVCLVQSIHEVCLVQPRSLSGSVHEVCSVQSIHEVCLVQSTKFVGYGS